MRAQEASGKKPKWVTIRTRLLTFIPYAIARVPVLSFFPPPTTTPMYSVALFAVVGVALPGYVVGVTVDSLPIAANLRLEPGATLVDRDRARFDTLFKRGDEERRAVSVDVKNTAVSLVWVGGWVVG